MNQGSFSAVTAIEEGGPAKAAQSPVTPSDIGMGCDSSEIVDVPWQAPVKNGPPISPPSPTIDQLAPKLPQAVGRAHVWLHDLKERYDSIETLAQAAKLHPKIVRQNLRLAFLAPSIIRDMFE